MSDVEQRVRDSRSRRGEWVDLARDLHEIKQSRAYVAHHRSFEAFLRHEQIGARFLYELVALHRELVVNRGVAPERLAQLSPSKLSKALPALLAGETTLAQLLHDVERLSRADLLVKQRGEQTVRCPVCSTRVLAHRPAA